MKKIFQILFSLFFIVLIINPTKTEALSIMPAQADPWFTYTYQPDLSKLPDGFSVTTKSDDVTTYTKIRNNTDYPLYIITYNTENKNHENPEVPKKYTPHYKLTREDSYYYDIYEPDRSPDRDYYQPLYGNEKSPTISFWEGSTYSLYFKDIKNIQQDDRPADAPIPETQTFNMVFLYNEKEILVPVKVVYQLNKNYDSNKFKNYRTQEKVQSAIPLIAFIFLLTSAIILKRKKLLFTRGMMMGISLYVLFSAVDFLVKTNELYSSSIFIKYLSLIHYPAILLFFGNSFYGSSIVSLIIVNIIIYGLIGAIVYAIFRRFKIDKNRQAIGTSKLS